MENDIIICSGVSIGTAKSAKSYVHTMSEIFDPTIPPQNIESELHLLPGLNMSRFPKCERNGVDQGTHNVLVHYGLIPGQIKSVYSLDVVLFYLPWRKHIHIHVYTIYSNESLEAAVLTCAEFTIETLHL